ncbi:MAG: response regulator [Desulfomonile tiedjei]|nr:response regulator [Desulfomonile tiedjei]
MSASESNKADRIKVLLVDDEEAYVRILEKRLTKRNFAVSTAFSGIQGVQAVRKAEFDVAVLDLKMEDIDGIEVLKIFKALVPKMAVIMLTGHGSEEAARDGIQYGAYDYLLKPCDFDDLVEKIKQAAGTGKTTG